MTTAPPATEPGLAPPSGSERGWWATRLDLVRRGGQLPGARIWALGEMLSMGASTATLAFAVGVLAASWWVPPAPWMVGGVLLVLLSGAVGYVTNFLAVQMLFKPRHPQDWLPMRWVWRQGLIPARQAILAGVVGEEVAARLLTPEAIVDEVTSLVEATLEDEGTLPTLQAGAQSFLQREVPPLLAKVLPEVVVAFERFLASEVSSETLRNSLRTIADQWFEDHANRETLASFLLLFLRQESGLLVEMVRKAVKRYAKKSGGRSLMLGLGEATSILDWDGLDGSLQRQLEKPKSRTWALELIDGFRGELTTLLDRIARGDWLDGLKGRAGEFLRGTAETISQREVVPRLVDFIGSGAFGHYLTSDVLPRTRPRLRSWIEAGNLDPILRRFDVRGRVAQAAASLDVAELEEMANRVAAYHLGAIQVLGYVLGILAGLLTWAVTALGSR